MKVKEFFEALSNMKFAANTTMFAAGFSQDEEYLNASFCGDSADLAKLLYCIYGQSEQFREAFNACQLLVEKDKKSEERSLEAFKTRLNEELKRAGGIPMIPADKKMKS